MKNVKIKDFSKIGMNHFRDKEMLQQFKNQLHIVKEYEKKNGGDSYIALSVKDYENLSLNFAELRRYIEQQKQIIIYDENAVKPEGKKDGKVQ